MPKTPVENTKTDGAVRAQTSRIRAQIKTLPADVQASIEHHYSENNDGARETTHSRQAMTERALKYQAMFGKRYSRGAA